MSAARTRRLRRRATGVATAAVLLAGQPLFIGSARATTQVPIPPFDASVSAYAVHVMTDIPGAPLTDTLIDGGGPTAQASFSSSGTGTAYAAFPDPGATITGLPDLLGGLLNVNLPLPPYPLMVNADDLNPKQSVGVGPYQIAASKTDKQVQGNVVAGLSLGAHVALMTSNASVTIQDDGSVSAKATTDIQGLAVGPLTIGEISSMATKTITPDGKITTSSDMRLDALKIGTLTVPLPMNGLEIAGMSLPISLAPVLQGLLKLAGLTLTVEKAVTTKDTVIAPALKITGPIPAKMLKLSNSDGTWSLELGQTSARLVGSAAPPAVAVPTGPNGASPVGAGTGIGPSSGVAAASTSSSGGGVVPPPTDIGSGNVAVAPQNQTTSAPPTQGFGQLPGTPQALVLASMSSGALTNAFGISSLYILVVVIAIGGFGFAQLIRHLGVRAPWTSTGG